MNHSLFRSSRHVRTSVKIYWPAGVVGFCIAASLAWFAFFVLAFALSTS